MIEGPSVGVRYTAVDESYFRTRGLRRYAGVASLWALGVGAVISGHFSGWNLGLAVGGWGGMLLAGLLITVMYLGLTLSIAEMSPALPHTGGAYSFARSAMGPWGGFLTGLCENVEYVLTPAVVVFLIGAYLSSIFATPESFQPIYWIVCYLVFVGLNIAGVELSFRVTMTVTLLALPCLIAFWITALPVIDFPRWALNIGDDGGLLPDGHGPLLPFGLTGAFAALPFAVWLFLAIEQLPLAAAESVDPKRDMPKGIILAMTTLLLSAFMVLWLNVSLPSGSHALGRSTEPLLDGFRAIYGDGVARTLATIAVIGLIASFHTIVYAKARQIYSLSRAGYLPTGLSLPHPQHQTPHLALLAGAVMGLAIMLAIWITLGERHGGAVIAGTLLNMAVFGAMLSYILQALSFILLRRRMPDIERPYRSPLGIPGALVTMVIAAVTIGFQLADPVYRAGVIGVLVWFALAIAYFALHARHRLVLSPEERFALSRGQAADPAW